METHNRQQPIIFFGAGFALTGILSQFVNNGFTIACICDNDPAKHGSLFKNHYEIISLENSLERFPGAMYIISTAVYFDEIKDLLESIIPAEQICPIDFQCVHYFRGRAFKAYVDKNMQRFEKLYATLHDDDSKAALYKIIKAHCSGKRNDFVAASFGDDDMYLFKSLLSPHANSVYIDCGAYDGDTVSAFHEAAINGYEKIIAFEPDQAIYKKLLHTISNNSITKIQPINKGSYDYSGKLSFISSDVYSFIADSNQAAPPLHLPRGTISEIKIEVTTIDEVMDGGYVDIIKMDIEGAEKKALMGAEKTIKKHKPRLAICLYHNIEDFLEIPELIINMVPEYKLYVRHKSKSGGDTILYAVAR